MIGTVHYLRPGIGHRRGIRYIAGYYGFACKILAVAGEKFIVTILHDDGSSSHYKPAIYPAQLHASRELAQTAWAAGRADRKAARDARRAARVEYLAALAVERASRRARAIA